MKTIPSYKSKTQKLKTTPLILILIFISQIVISQSGEKFFNIANQKFDSADFKGAVEYYTKCIELEPSLAEAYHNRALSKCNLKDYTGAINDLDKCISIDSTKADFYYNRARAKYFNRDYIGCIIDNSIVIEMNPNFGLAYLNRGLVRVIIGNKDAGCIDLTKAKELNAKNAQEIMNEYCK